MQLSNATKSRAGRPLSVEHGRIIADGRERSYTAVFPAVLSPARALLIVLHGSNQSGEKVRAFSGYGFDEIAATGEAVVVYPDAYKGLWNDARTGALSAARREGVDDIAFIHTLIAHFQQAHTTERVFVAGYSNGGQLAIRLAHELPDRLAGVALIGATQPTPDNLTVADQHGELPVLLMHGTRDPLVPYAGGMASLWGFRPRGTGLSAPESAAYFARRNGITTPSTTETLPHHPDSGNTAVTVTRFVQAGKPPVVLYTIENGGHVIPNSRKNALFILGKTTHDIEAAEAIWAFFRSV